MRLLIVANSDLSTSLKRSFEQEGFQVDVSTTGEDGFCKMTESDFDLAIIDEVLPTRGGLWIIDNMRSVDPDMAMVLLTERGSVEDRVKGLDFGADDYVIKPFALPELVARVRTILRRRRKNTRTSLKVGDLEIDLVTRKVTRANTTIDLTMKEFTLLAYLMKNSGVVVTRQTLAREVWNIDTDIICVNNILDVHMTRLRKKIDSQSPVIVTVRGMGFMMKGPSH